jgi:hypothetical protein
MKIEKMLVALIFGLGLTLGLVWLLGGGLPVRAAPQAPMAELHVCPSGCAYSSIQTAVDAADPGDVIKVAQSDYTDVHQRSGITQVVYISKTVTIRGGYTTTNWTTPDLVAHPTTLDAQGLGRVLVITGSITPTIEGLRITGGDASGLGGLRGDPAYYDAGGGVYVYGAMPTISHCVIYSNTASTLDRGFGGGLYLEGVITLTGNTVQENIASTAHYGAGGGMYLRDGDGSTLNGNTILTNTASTSYTGNGGGTYLRQSYVLLTGNTFQGNVGSKATSAWGSGGGLYAYFCDVTLVGNTIRGNVGGTTYSAYGGGVYLRDAEATLESNWIIDNAASQAAGYTGLGGGVYVYKTRVITLINNVVADNYAYSHGSGLYIDSEPTAAITARFLHNTIADNWGGTGGLYLADYTTAFMTNTILAGHTNAALRVEASSTATLEATLWHGNGSLTYGDGVIISSTNVYSAPGFVDPSTWDYHLAADSAAIDAGVDSGIAIDIDGETRPAGGYDLGADEYWNRVYLPLVLKN